MFTFTSLLVVMGPPLANSPSVPAVLLSLVVVVLSLVLFADNSLHQ